MVNTINITTDAHGAGFCLSTSGYQAVTRTAPAAANGVVVRGRMLAPTQGVATRITGTSAWRPPV